MKNQQRQILNFNHCNRNSITFVTQIVTSRINERKKKKNKVKPFQPFNPLQYKLTSINETKE